MGKSLYRPWVPAPVVDFVASALREPYDKPSRDRLQLLVESADMETAWKTLTKTTNKPELLVAFTQQAAFSLWLSWGSHLLPTTSATKQRTQARKVADASQTLLEHLERLGSGHAERGARMLVAGAHRASLQAYSKRQYGLQRRSATLAHPLRGNPSAEVVRLLQWLHAAANMTVDAPSPPGPRKLADKHAVRTAYVIELAAVIQREFKKPLYAVVAITTNVMFDEFEHPLSADHVRKLVLPQKKVSRTAP